MDYVQFLNLYFRDAQIVWKMYEVWILGPIRIMSFLIVRWEQYYLHCRTVERIKWNKYVM